MAPNTQLILEAKFIQDKIREKLRKLRRKNATTKDQTLESRMLHDVATKEARMDTSTARVNGATKESDELRAVSLVNGSRLALETSIGEETAISQTIFAESVDTSRGTVDEELVRSATTKATDLTGKWELVVSEDFKTNYDNYLKLLGQPSLGE